MINGAESVLIKNKKYGANIVKVESDRVKIESV